MFEKTHTKRSARCTELDDKTQDRWGSTFKLMFQFLSISWRGQLVKQSRWREYTNHIKCKRQIYLPSGLVCCCFEWTVVTTTQHSEESTGDHRRKVQKRINIRALKSHHSLHLNRARRKPLDFEF